MVIMWYVTSFFHNKLWGIKLVTERRAGAETTKGLNVPALSELLMEAAKSRELAIRLQRLSEEAETEAA